MLSDVPLDLLLDGSEFGFAEVGLALRLHDFVIGTERIIFGVPIRVPFIYVAGPQIGIVQQSRQIVVQHIVVLIFWTTAA